MSKGGSIESMIVNGHKINITEDTKIKFGSYYEELEIDFSKVVVLTWDGKFITSINLDGLEFPIKENTLYELKYEVQR